MSTKKSRFLGSPLSTEIADTIRQGQQEDGDVNVELIPLSRIDVDVENPRRTGFGVGDLTNPEALIGDDKNRRRTWEALQELALSIKSVGIQQPIKVYRHLDRFRIAFGERRFLASHLAEMSSIPAWILQEKPAYLRNIQYIENMQREDLTAWERIWNIKAIVNEYKSIGGGKVTVSVLSELTGMSRSRASHYLTILSGPEDVQELVKSGSINNIEKAGFLSRIKDNVKRKLATDLFLRGNNQKEVEDLLLKAETDAKADSGKSIRSGRPRTRVNLGQTANTALLRKIMVSIPLEGIPLPAEDSEDWNDLTIVSERWKQFLAELEREVLKVGRKKKAN